MNQREIDRAASAMLANPEPHHKIDVPEPGYDAFWRVDFPCIVAVIAIWAGTFLAIGAL